MVKCNDCGGSYSNAPYSQERNGKLVQLCMECFAKAKDPNARTAENFPDPREPQKEMPEGWNPHTCEAGVKKSALHLIPTWPLMQLGNVLRFGKEKYDIDQWRNSKSKRTYVGKALRHIFEWLGGKDVDEDSGEHPLAHALADLMMAMELPDSSDDRYKGEQR